MDSTKRALAIAAIIGLGACARGVAAPAASENDAAAGFSVTTQNATVSLPVKVTNTAGDWAAPVPTVAQGTTNVSGTVAAAQTGAWNVGVSGTVGAQQVGDYNVKVISMPNVNIANPVTLAANSAVSIAGTPTVNVANFPASTGGSAGLGQRYAEGTTGTANQGNETTPVPSGKRLVLTHLSAFGYTAPGHRTNASIMVSPSNGGNFLVELSIPMTLKTQVAGFDYYSGTQQVDLIIEAGDTVRCLVYNEGAPAQGSSCSFFGRLIDAP